MKIYVASSWRNYYHPLIVELLRSFDHSVYDFKNPPHGRGGFAWSEIDPAWEQWTKRQYIKALSHDAMKWADVCLLVLPCGRSAHSEAGWMKGAGKKVFVFSPENHEPELMYKFFDGILLTIEDLRQIFGGIAI